MKITLLLLVSIFTFMTAQAQVVVGGVDSVNVAYVGRMNLLNIDAGNSRCPELSATTDNGTIEKEDSCHFYYMPANEGSGTVIFRKRLRGKIIVLEHRNMQCKKVPDPRLVIGNKGGGSILLTVLKAQKGVRIGLAKDASLYAGFSVVSFTISFYYSPCGDRSEEIIGDKFTPQTTVFINKLKVGDKIILANIKVKGPDNKMLSLGGDGELFTVK